MENFATTFGSQEEGHNHRLIMTLYFFMPMPYCDCRHTFLLRGDYYDGAAGALTAVVGSEGQLGA